MNKEIEEDAKFTLHLTYPPYHKLQCILTKSKPDHIYITCQIDHPMHSFIFIGQQVIRKSTYGSIHFYGWQTLVRPIEKLILYEEASAKKDVSLTFRQVNQFYFRPIIISLHSNSLVLQINIYRQDIVSI